MTKKLTAIATTLTIALAASTGAAFAQDDANADQGERRNAPRAMHKYDVNKDGVIDATELADAPERLVARDANNDGEITRAELKPDRDGKRGPKGKCKNGKKGGRKGGGGGGGGAGA